MRIFFIGLFVVVIAASVIKGLNYGMLLMASFATFMVGFSYADKEK